MIEEYFDSHVHFSKSDEPGYGIAEQLDRAAASGVRQMVAVGGSCDLNAAAVKAAGLAPDRVRVALGFDRDQKDEMSSSAAISDATGRLARVVDSAPSLHMAVCAIGEIGLDYHYTPETRLKQMALFGAQCELAQGLGLPVVVHSREADEDTLAILGRNAGLKGVLHCFTGSAAFAEALVALGFMISFSGILTFRNADALREVARIVPGEHLLIETDSPYLAPVPHRGKRNEPAFLTEVAAVLASVRGASVEHIARLTTANARRLFGFPS